jgi:23S rRNA (cytosine1962-C5)-methyltransferase
MIEGTPGRPTAPRRRRLHLRVTAAAVRRIRSGHPWIYSESVLEQNREGATGELAVIFDGRNKFLAVGLYDGTSPIRVRVLHTGKPIGIDGAFWRQRIESCMSRRVGIFDSGTTAGRLINGESDGWPGLVLDRYAEVLVVKLYTAAWFSRLDEFLSLVRALLDPQAMVLRLSRNLDAAARAAGIAEEFLFDERAEKSDRVIFRENGLLFEADVRRGQKTGFFLDQRENRARVGALAAGRDVLNVFSFSGGFSLHAARGGASTAVDLDQSAHALEAARRNFQLNASDPAVAATVHETIQADAFKWLAKSRRMFGLIVVDPPSMARRESEKAAAIGAYERLAGLALGRLRSGGILVISSCSSHVAEADFRVAVKRTVGRSGRPGRMLWQSGHPADHPATFPEARYLKCLAMQF